MLFSRAIWLIHLAFVSEALALQWTSPGLPNGTTVTACQGQTVSLNWTYSAGQSEQVVDVDWLFRGQGRSEIVLASCDRGSFLVKQNIITQISYLPKAGLRLFNVTSQESGQYTVEVNLLVQGSQVTKTQSVTLTIADPPVLHDKLRVSYNPDQSRLSCGFFASRGAPPVNVVFTTPCKKTYSPSSYSNGYFNVLLPRPVTGGNYTCQLVDGLSSRCLNNGPAAASLHKASTLVLSSAAQARFPQWMSLFRPTQGPRDCGDVQKYTNVSGVYVIYINNAPVGVYCDQDSDGGGWTVIQRRQDGSVNFTRYYDEFEAGFGDVYGEYWLGLKYIHQLTSQVEYELRVDMADWEGNSTYALYNNFSIADGSDKYRLHLGPLVTGPSASSYHMSYNNGRQFSALGSDNSGFNCVATTRETAWWFGYCTLVNPNGLYLHGYEPLTSGHTESRIIWNSFRGSDYSLKRIEMKIRRRDR